MRFVLVSLLSVLTGCPSPVVPVDGGTDASAASDVPPLDAPGPADVGSDASGPDTPDGCGAVEICGNGIDDDCSGTADDVSDVDGDGWTRCDGDCCETAADCVAPERVNPGAYDFVGDGQDDDCSGVADDPTASCDAAFESDESDAARYGAALGLCDTTTESAPLPERTWGLVSAAFALADGSGSPVAASRAIRPSFGAIVPGEGGAMVVLSSGHAAAPGHVRPFFSPGLSTELSTTAGVPADWLAAHGGTLPAAPSCPSPIDETAYDSVLLRLRVRVPTNARALALDTFFLTSEFPEWVCSAYSDYAVVLLESAATTNPADHNLAQYAAPAGAVPLGTGAASGNTGLFAACRNGATGCADPSVVSGSISTCTSTELLSGTGFDLPQAGFCDPDSLLGGGTGWLTVRGNVVPGEIIELRLAIWDSSDRRSDSSVLFDALRWLPDPVDAGLSP